MVIYIYHFLCFLVFDWLGDSRKFGYKRVVSWLNIEMFQ